MIIMYTLVSIVATLNPSAQAHRGASSLAPSRAGFTTHSLIQQTDERAGRDCTGGSTVKVFAHASDMGKVSK